jgi:hypothetical protein
MAVVSVRERFQSRRASYRDGVLTHVREWLVRCSDPTDGPAVALTADDGSRRVPPPFTGHPRDPGAKLTSLEASPHENSDVLFLVSGEYTTTRLGLPPNPLDHPPEVSYSFTDGTEAYFIDHSTPDPKRVTTSAGDPFETYLERETGELVINITTNEDSFNVVDMDELKHSTNNGPIIIDGVTFAEGTLKLSPPSAQKVIETVEGEGGAVQRFVYYRVSWQLKARKACWNDKVLDAGTNELVPDGDITKPPKLKPIVDGASLPVKRPWPLDGSGRKRSSPTDKPAELEFVPYKPGSWSWRWTTAHAWAA